MLSILTAAETEMYESSKKNEELIQQQRLISSKPNVSTEDANVQVDLIKDTGGDDSKKQLKQYKSQITNLEEECEKLKNHIDSEKKKFQKKLDDKETQL